MTGYIGDAATAAQEIAMDHVDNLLWAARQELPPEGAVSAHECEDCGDPIPEKRRLAMVGCTRCIQCQDAYDKRPKTRIRMLDHVL